MSGDVQAWDNFSAMRLGGSYDRNDPQTIYRASNNPTAETLSSCHLSGFAGHDFALDYFLIRAPS